ncbi:MAG TPA: hypothetical protein VFV86_05545, partial [Nitrososphaeraceae archaeon]|nr:hypothetical protein [Nitrososphaeraceae archaeon]
MQEDIKKKVNSIKKQQIEYAKPIVIIVFMVATAIVPIYFEAVNAEKDQNSSDYLLSNLYELKINFIECGNNLCNHISTNIPTNIDEKTVTVQGQKIFYLEAGRENNQTILLLHGYPTSSNMYRDLIPKLA